MKIYRLALVDDQYMTNELQTRISQIRSFIQSANLNLKGKSFTANQFDPLVTAIKDLDTILEANDATRFAPMKSHSNQLVHLIYILNQKFMSGQITDMDYQSVLKSLALYDNDLTSVV